MTIEQFIKFAKDCKSKPELSSLAKANGISLKKNELDEIFNKISSGSELNNEELTNAAGGSSAYGNKEVLTEGLKLPTGLQ